jgi:Gluconate 2-dehydrogenase subunit 3
MNDSHQLLVQTDSAGNASQPELLSRREASRRFLGVAAMWSVDRLHPVWRHLSTQSSDLLQAAGDLGSGTWKPKFLAADQSEALTSVSERIVPGSTKALVAPFIDLLLSVDSAEVQESFNRSLAAFEDEARQRSGSALQQLSASQTDELLATASTSPEGSTLRAAFENLKNWIVGVYYSSESGMTELGWTPNRFFPGVPGCPHPEEQL